MLERVELAIRRAMDHEDDADPTAPMRYALAAVQAMREPTDEMLAAASPSVTHRLLAKALWCAQIDAILTPEITDQPKGEGDDA